MDRIDVGDLQAICHDASRRRSSSRSHGDPVLLGIIDEIPHDQEVVHISHSLNNTQLIIQALPESLSGLSGGLIAVTVAFRQSVIAKLIQVAPGIIPLRHIVFRQLCHAEFDLHVTAVRDPLGILHCLPGIGEQSLHFLFALDIILPALVAHTILVRQLFARLQAQQDVMRDRILGIGIVHIVGGHQGNVQLSAHLEQFHIYRALFRDAVIL